MVEIHPEFGPATAGVPRFHLPGNKHCDGGWRPNAAPIPDGWLPVCGSYPVCTSFLKLLLCSICHNGKEKAGTVTIMIQSRGMEAGRSAGAGIDKVSLTLPAASWTLSFCPVRIGMTCRIGVERALEYIWSVGGEQEFDGSDASRGPGKASGC